MTSKQEEDVGGDRKFSYTLIVIKSHGNISDNFAN